MRKITGLLPSFSASHDTPQRIFQDPISATQTDSYISNVILPTR